MYQQLINKYYKRRRILKIMTFVIALGMFAIFIFFMQNDIDASAGISSVFLWFLFGLLCFGAAFSFLQIGYVVNISRFNYILAQDCDAQKYSEILEEIFENDKGMLAKSAIIIPYLMGLFYSDKQKIHEVLKEGVNHKWVKNNNIIYLMSDWNDITEITSEEYEKYYLLSKKACTAKNKMNEIMLENIEMKYLVDHRSYQEAYEYCLNRNNLMHNIEKVINQYHRGVCLYLMDKHDEAKILFENVIQEGNTLQIVEQAKDYLEKMK